MEPALSKTDIVRAIRNERRRTLTLLRGLPDGDFDRPATPGWCVRDVVAHLVTLDRAAVLGGILPLVVGSRGTDRLERWNDRQVKRWTNRPIPDLLMGLERWGRRFGREMAALPAALFRVTLPTAWGKAPAGMVIWIRAYDEWVHRQDIRRALAMEDESVDVAPVAEFLLHVLAYETVPRLAEREPGRIALALDGAGVPEWLYETGGGRRTAARAGPRGALPFDARIIAPASAFIMAAAGRGTFQDLKSSSTLTIAGKEALADAFLSVLRIV